MSPLLCSLCTSVSSGSRPCLQPAAGARSRAALQAPGHWGIQTEFSTLGPWRLKMSNNSLVTRIRFHRLCGNYLHVLEGPPPPFPQSLHSLGFSGLDLGEEEKMDFRKALARIGNQLNKPSTCQEWSWGPPKGPPPGKDVRPGQAKLEKIPKVRSAARAEQANQAPY